jgi:hypothetical protein
MSSTTEKKKKSKLDKIYELQAANKGLKPRKRKAQGEVMRNRILHLPLLVTMKRN